jgi:hypothetical protein
MSAAGQSTFERGAGALTPVSILSSSKLSQHHSEVPQAESLRDKTMSSANGTFSRRKLEPKRNNNSDGKNARRDWLAAKIASMSVAEVQEITGLTETAIHNIRRGKNAISHENLCLILEARPDFRAAFFLSVGGELLVDPGRVVAIERAFHSIMRGEGDY